MPDRKSVTITSYDSICSRWLSPRHCPRRSDTSRKEGTERAQFLDCSGRRYRKTALRLRLDAVCGDPTVQCDTGNWKFEVTARGGLRTPQPVGPLWRRATACACPRTTKFAHASARLIAPSTGVEAAKHQTSRHTERCDRDGVGRERADRRTSGAAAAVPLQKRALPSVTVLSCATRCS
jgi:hypothetical protein